MSISRHREAKQWLKNLPSGWRVVTVKQCAEITYGFPAESEGFTTDPNYIPLIRIRDITSGHAQTYYSGTYPKESLIDDGDVLIGMDGDFNLRVWTGGQALLNQRCCRVAGNTPEVTKFLSYALPYALTEIHNLTLSTTVKHLLADGIEKALLPLPDSTEELRSIVSVLDAETFKIDRAVDLLRQQLETLVQLKKSLIYEAVTKGLDTSVRMKPSGVEWVGDIPEHWGLNRLRYLVTFESGATPSKDNLNFWNGDIPWVSSQEVKGDVIEETTYRISQSAVASCSTKILPKGTPILVVRSGILQHTVPIALLQRPMAINQDVKALVTKGEILPSFLMYFVKGHNENLVKLLVKDKSTVDNVSSEYLKNLMVTVPPPHEQLKIVNALDAKCEFFDKTIRKKRTQLSLLEQQRKSLIFEYVTGKRRVGEVA